MRYFIAVTFAALVAFFWVGQVKGHDHNRPELNGWFSQLRSPGHGLCCDGSDALSLDDPDYENTNGHYHVRIDGQWIDVPDDAVVTVPNQYGRALVWPMMINGEVKIRCFLPGAMT